MGYVSEASDEPYILWEKKWISKIFETYCNKRTPPIYADILILLRLLPRLDGASSYYPAKKMEQVRRDIFQFHRPALSPDHFLIMSV